MDPEPDQMTRIVLHAIRLGATLCALVTLTLWILRAEPWFYWWAMNTGVWSGALLIHHDNTKAKQ